MRFSPHDFKGYSRDGYGADWPFEYEALEPWYEKTEQLVGVCGDNPGLDDIPDANPGVLHKPPKPRVVEMLVKAACNKLDIPVAHMHRAILTKPIDDRQACFWATNCGRGCSIGAAFQTTTSVIPMAKATGNLKVVTDAMVKNLQTDVSGRISSVNFVDRLTGKTQELKAGAVVLAASACESARILLNSKTDHFVDGLANGSRQVGKNLLDSTGVSISGYVPGLENRPRYNEDGHTGNHYFIPWWGHDLQARGELNFSRGYHFEFGGAFGAPSIGLGFYAKGFGDQLKQSVYAGYGSGVGFSLRGEMVPNSNCYMDIDPNVQDKWGIPVPRFHWRWGEQELNQAAHGMQTAAQIIETMGGYVRDPERTPEEALKKGGEIIHEVGTTRMGSSAQTSVTNEFGQTWQHDNLFIMDGGVFASNPHKNCTLTIMTLAMRNATHLSQRLASGGV